MTSIVEGIKALKEEKNAVILAHNYCLPEVQDVADFVGDSLGLSKKAAETDADVIVFCGVTFMGETAKILSPNKTVLLPEPQAICAMAAMCTAEQIDTACEEDPDCLVVGYVNSTAEAKSRMDVCCTSSNAVKVVESLGKNRILFVPDKNLGSYAKEKTGADVVLWNGFCPVHQTITYREVLKMKEEHPDAKVIAHPECREDVLSIADGVGSTEKMFAFVTELGGSEFIVLTECGMGHRLESVFPDKQFYFPPYAICGAMKMVDLPSILECLETGKTEIVLDKDVLKNAYEPVKRMTDISG